MAGVRKRIMGRDRGPTLPTHAARARGDGASSSPQILAAIIVLGVTAYIGISWLNHYQIKRGLYTPQSSDKIVSAKPDMKRFWGSYRPQVYFGMKTMSPRSIVTGMMWLEQYQQPAGNFPLRHTCEQGDLLPSYGWIAHDGLNFGMQDIVESKYILRTEFVKKLGGDHGGDWSWRVTGIGSRGNVTVSLFFYAATDQVGELTPIVKKEGANTRMSEIKGFTEDLGQFVIKFPKSDKVTKQQFHYTSTEVEGLHKLKDGVMRKLFMSKVSLRGAGGRKSNFYHLIDEDLPAAKVQNPKSKMLVHQVTMETPFEIEVIFESGSVKQRQFELSGSKFTSTLANLKMKYDQKFEVRFPLSKKGYTEEQISFAKAAFSNMIGGIGYFYGSSLVQSQYEPQPLPYFETHLLTAVPSRSFFPRGFLWDEGFHQLLISKWDRELSLLILGHWLDTMNAEGWIPREQILGDEAISKVPAEFVVQSNTNANPPTFFLALSSIIGDMDKSIKGMTDNERETLTKMYPKLQSWYDWFNNSQSGPVPGSYRWRGRDADSERELNPKTLTSGLDDYPRASHPSSDERHVDLRCWMALASDTMARIAAKVGADSTKYEATYAYLRDNKLLNALHWSEQLNSYADYGNHTSKVQLIKREVRPERPGMPVTHKVLRQTRGAPKPQFVNAKGYVSLFPFLLQLLEPDSPQLAKILDDLTNEHALWSNFGLRSLSQTDPMYMKRNTEHDPPYWRGAVWININFLAARALKYYSTAAGPPLSKLAQKIHDKLRENLVKNIYNHFLKTGYIWENYSDMNGAGKGCHPFTGWSALVVLIMSEEYGL